MTVRFVPQTDILDVAVGVRKSVQVAQQGTAIDRMILSEGTLPLCRLKGLVTEVMSLSVPGGAPG